MASDISLIPQNRIAELISSLSSINDSISTINSTITTNNNNAVHKTGNETITGTKRIAPFYVIKENSDKEGGQIQFDSADNESNAGKSMWLDRFDGRFRFVGVDSNDVIHVPLQIDIQNNQVLGVTTVTSDNSTQIATTAWKYNNDNLYRTNCLTEIPQDIKLELNNGTLTLKAGSKVYVPNGFEADETTPKFDEVVTTIDITYGTISTTAASRLLFVNVNNNTFADGSITYCSSGDTTKMNSTTAYNYSRFYNTETNKMYTGDGSSWEERSWALPIAIITNNSSGTITSIDQVFNGFGYIGSTIFALPDVKGLIPNGRNANGTLKSTNWTCNSVVVRTFPTSENYTNAAFGFNGSAFSRLGSSAYSYNQSENYNYNNADVWDVTFLGSLNETAGVVSNFNVRTSFHAVDWNELSQGRTFRTVIDTWKSGTSWYRVWSDGWIEQGGICASHQYNTTLQQVNFSIPYKNTDYMALTCAGPTTGQLWQIATRIAVKTTTGLDIRGGQNANAAYTGDAAWYTCGY